MGRVFVKGTFALIALLVFAVAARAQVPAQIASDPRALVVAITQALNSGKIPDGWFSEQALKAVIDHRSRVGAFPLVSDVQVIGAREMLPGLVEYEVRVLYGSAAYRWRIVLNRVTGQVAVANIQAESGAIAHFQLPMQNPVPLPPPPPTSWSGGVGAGGPKAGSGAGGVAGGSGAGGPGAGGAMGGSGQQGSWIGQPKSWPPSNSGFGGNPGAPKMAAGPAEPQKTEPQGYVLHKKDALPDPFNPKAAVAGPLRDARVVEFLVASTRARAAGDVKLIYGGERAAEMSFAAAAVRIPEDHKIGKIEIPRRWELFGVTLKEDPKDPTKHFIVSKVLPISADKLNEIIAEKKANSALVFVHGFRTSFEEALFRNAQIVWDLQFSGVSVLFTWASRGSISEYGYDRNSAFAARDSFLQLLRILKEQHGIEHVNILAHSMGNLIALEALSINAQTAKPLSINELIMAAPDIDRDTYVQLAPRVRKIVRGMTLYASSADKALGASKMIAGLIPRAGDVSTSTGPIILPDIDTIDVTSLGEEMLGLNHSVFASVRAMMDDIKILLTSGTRPPHNRLSQIRRFPEAPAVSTHWKYAQ